MTLLRYFTCRCCVSFGHLPSFFSSASAAVGRCLVGVDDARILPILQAVQRLAEKALGRLGIARRREIEPASHLHVFLVDAPARRTRPAPLPAQALLDLRSVLLDPSENR